VKVPPQALPSKAMRELDLDRVPKEILQVMKKGQGKQNCCVAFAIMNDHLYRGTWDSGSMRFLHCICKMLDGGMRPELGTTWLTGIRAEKGYWTSEEKLWPSDVDLELREFEHWQRIPNVAWEDARKRRIESNKTRFSLQHVTSVSINGRDLALFVNCKSKLAGGDKQYDLVLFDTEFERIAWVQFRAYHKNKGIVLEDLFVKQEARRCGIGSDLLQRSESIVCSDQDFRAASDEITVPIPRVDIWLPDRNVAVREFFKKNGYSWKNRQVVPGPEYSVLTALKKLPRTAADSTNSFDDVCSGNKLVDGPGIVYVRLVNSAMLDAWQLLC
jgi:GNAT superfamily N-acetyltransferase